MNFKLKNIFIILSVLLSCTISSQVYNFSNAGATASVGPTQAQLNLAYATTNLSNAVSSNSGIQNWTVPTTGAYKISAIGASGAGNGGYGSQMQGEFNLIAGQVLQIVVGQQGQSGTGAVNNSGGGGGGSFVVLGIDSLLIAAGGGGAGSLNAPGGNASTLTLGGSTIWNGAGDNGNGGTSGITNGDAAGGGGFYTDGGNSYNTAQTICEGGKAFLNGATGGASGTCGNYYGGAGGFGGGGSGWHNGINRGGAGGGYSGGQGGTLSSIISGGGGGSYNSGTNQNNFEGIGNGNGSVMITSLNGLPVTLSPNNLGTGTIITKTYITTNLVQATESNSRVSIYPNPNNGIFQIEMKDNSKMQEYLIYDMNGRIVLKKRSEDEILKFDITELSNGIYYVKIGSKAVKIVKD